MPPPTGTLGLYIKSSSREVSPDSIPEPPAANLSSANEMSISSSNIRERSLSPNDASMDTENKATAADALLRSVNNREELKQRETPPIKEVLTEHSHYWVYIVREALTTFYRPSDTLTYL